MAYSGDMKGGGLIRLLFRRRSSNPGSEANEARVGVADSDRRRRNEAIDALAYTPTEELFERRAELQAAAEDAGLTLDEIGAVLDARPELPRPLLPIERETLLAILGYADFEGRNELLAQVDAAMVDGYDSCGCAGVTFRVNPDAPRAPTAPSTVPNFAAVFDSEDEEIGGIMICVADGYLTGIEIHDYFLPPFHGISPLPPIDQLKISR